MNYTENFHLPQWAKSDRIMMEDFNQMCKDMEDGMTGNAQKAQNASQSSDALDKKTLHRLCRVAYNHYSAVQNMSPLPWQAGVFHQNPSQDGSNVSNAAKWNGVCFAGNGPMGTIPGNLSEYSQQVSPLKIVKNHPEACVPLEVSIYMEGCTYLNRFSLCGDVSNNVPNTSAPARLTLTNQDTGEIELSQTIDIKMDIASGYKSNLFVDTFVPFHGGQHYLLKIEPLAAVFDAQIDFLVSAQTVLYGFYSSGSITAAHTMRECEGSSGGLLIVRGLVNGPDGQLTVKWDGKEVPLYTTRMVRIPDGRCVREMVYYRDEPIPAETKFDLRFDTGEFGSCLFYDWGAVLL